VIALRAADQTFLVVPAEVRACAAASRVAAHAAPHCPRISLVVRRPGPGRLSVDEVANAVGRPVAGVLRNEQRLAAALDRGDMPLQARKGLFAALCEELIAGVSADARWAA
jgi:hypothetical protein